MTIGIGVSIKADLGVSPVSSVPYTITLIAGIEMGKATILFHIALVLLQVIILRKEFELKQLAQVPVGVLFGYFTTFSNYLTGLLPSPEHLAFQLLFLLISIIIVAIGLFLYIPADMIPLAGEGAMLAISRKTGISFPKVKIGFDVTVVLISGVVGLSVMHRFGSVGSGTVLAAVLVGVVLTFISRRFNERYCSFLEGVEMKVGAAEFEEE